MKLLLPLALLALALPLRADEAEAVVSGIAIRYRAIEAALPSAKHQQVGIAVEDGERVVHAWSRPDRNWLKLADILADSHGQMRTELFLEEGEVFFAFRHRETTRQQKGAPTEVVEDRYYLDGGRLVRHLRKTASFPVGKQIVMDNVQNESLPPAQPAPGDASELQELSSAAREVAQHLKIALPVPLAERSFRVIQGTESPDKRFALGVGLSSERADNPQARLLRDESNYEPETPGLCNYLVNLQTRTILTETGAKHYGSKASYNHMEGRAFWAPGGGMALELCTAKWEFTACRLLYLDSDSSNAGLLDLGPLATQQATAFLKKENDRGWREHGPEMAINIAEPVLTDDTVSLLVLGEVPKGDTKGFAVRVKFRISVRESGEVRAEPVSVGWQ